MTALITFLILTPIIVGVCAVIWADEHWNLLDRAAARSTFAAHIRNLIDEPTR